MSVGLLLKMPKGNRGSKGDRAQQLIAQLKKRKAARELKKQARNGIRDRAQAALAPLRATWGPRKCNTSFV